MKAGRAGRTTAVLKCAAVAAGALLLLNGAAAFGDDFYRHGHGYWHEHPRYYHGPRVIVVPPPHVVYVEPPPVVYIPAPVASAPAIPANPASPVYQAQDGRYCREYQATVIVGGQPRPSYGTACLEPDGAWHIVSGSAPPPLH